MEKELVVREEMTALDIRNQVNLIQEVMKEVMTEGQHYGKIPGCGEKPTLLKPGAEKLSMTFRLRPIMDNDRDIAIEKLNNGHINIRVYCHIMSAQGLELATGIGSCSTMESKFRYRGGEKKPTEQSVPKEYWNLKKAGNLSEAQDLIGGKGFGVAKVDGAWQICEIGEKMENPDIADTYNTVLKIAKKRAYIDGILSATGASDIFTQDIEDFAPGTIVQEQEHVVTNKKPAVDMPKEKIVESPQEPAWGKEEVTEEELAKPVKPKGSVISEAQGKRLYAIYKSNGYSDSDVIGYLAENYSIKSTRDIEKADYDNIVSEFSTPK
jgi:hypothetical protein